MPTLTPVPLHLPPPASFQLHSVDRSRKKVLLTAGYSCFSATSCTLLVRLFFVVHPLFFIISSSHQLLGRRSDLSHFIITMSIHPDIVLPALWDRFIRYLPDEALEAADNGYNVSVCLYLQTQSERLFQFVNITLMFSIQDVLSCFDTLEDMIFQSYVRSKMRTLNSFVVQGLVG